MKLYTFQTVRLPIIRSLFPVHTARKLCTDPYDNTIAVCTVNKLAMMGRRTVRNM